MMTQEQAVRQIRRTCRCTEAQALALGYVVVRGNSTTTRDDRADGWYLDPIDGVGIDHTGTGSPIKEGSLGRLVDLVHSAEEYLATGEVRAKDGSRDDELYDELTNILQRITRGKYDN